MELCFTIMVRCAFLASGITNVMPAPLHFILKQSGKSSDLRRLDAEYHLQLAAENSTQLARANTQLLEVQARDAISSLRLRENTSQAHEYTNTLLSTLGGSMSEHFDDMSQGVAAIVEGLESIEECLGSAINGLAEDLSDRLETISGQLSGISMSLSDLTKIQWEARTALMTISQSLSTPYETSSRELRRQASRWIELGNRRTDEAKRMEDWKDALRLLEAATDNPIGRQDYAAWNDIGWLRWKYQSDLELAKQAFIRAERLSAASLDEFHPRILENLARMYYLQGDYCGAFKVIRENLSDRRTAHLLYDAARYAALNSETEQALGWLEQSIGLNPMLYVAMLSEPDFGLPR